ncbi:hypothetical protein [Ectobacillus ponti]|uniref:Uncharacterized protein n=1 Tax=Ectobacillus ponti TaxID=2961894 RepID=A0AA42BQU0_9BACI|nr:hypothetical protein [Ectobacillus ponti]
MDKVELGVLIAIASLAVAYLGYSLNRKRDMRADVQQDAEVKAKLTYIQRGVDDIRLDIKASERKISDLGERVTRVEESAKQAHKRLDAVEGGEKR